MANAHLMAAVPNRLMLESNMTPNPLKEGLFKEWFGAKNGYFDVPQKPGLGVELKEGLAELYPPIPEGNWNRPDPDMPPRIGHGRRGRARRASRGSRGRPRRARRHGRLAFKARGTLSPRAVAPSRLRRVKTRRQPKGLAPQAPMLPPSSGAR